MLTVLTMHGVCWSHGVGWFSELAGVMTSVTSERVMDVGAWARSYKNHRNNN